MPLRALLAAALAVATAVSACGSDGGPARSGGPSVLVTTTQLGDFARAVAGDAAQVHQLLAPNSDPHEYEPRPADVRAAAGAALVVLSGNGLDEWMEQVVDAAGGDAERLEIAPEHTPHRLAAEEDGGADPHWWHDPRNVEAAVSAIRDALARAEPSRAAVYERNARAYLEKVRRLDAGIAACMAQVPAEQRKLVTSHDAFGHFASRYGITVVGAIFPARSTRAQPSAGAVQQLAALVRREGVRAIFPEGSIDSKLAAALARETGASADFTLHGDTLGPEGSPAATYLGMERANADAMVRGFTGGARRCRIAGL